MQGKCFYYFVSLVCSKIFIGQQCVEEEQPIPGDDDQKDDQNKQIGNNDQK